MLLLPIYVFIYADFCWCSERVDLSPTQLIESFGYPVEVHEVETEDGYLLDIFRIPHGKERNAAVPNKHPVLVTHGLLGTSELFLLLGPTKSLAYLLADNGYDVWLLNCRGTWHSRKHKFLNPDQDVRYWKFTWHEIGYYDIPNTIDYVLGLTKTNALHYVGHSQGATSFFVMGSEKPEYNKKIRLMVGLAPAATLINLKDPIQRLLAPLYPILTQMVESLELYEVIPKQILSNDGIRLLTKSICDSASNLRDLCVTIILALNSFVKDDQLDETIVSHFLSTNFGGASVYQLLHYAQVIVKGRFLQYDWGPTENLRRYHSRTPPDYNLKNITCPVSLIYGDGDQIVTEKNVEAIGRSLPNVVEIYRVPFKGWGHIDFVWAKDLYKFLNKHVIELMLKFN